MRLPLFLVVAVWIIADSAEAEQFISRGAVQKALLEGHNNYDSTYYPTDYTTTYSNDEADDDADDSLTTSASAVEMCAKGYADLKLLRPSLCIHQDHHLMSHGHYNAVHRKSALLGTCEHYHFDMGEELGEGFFGKVYKAKHQVTGKYFAIKAIDEGREEWHQWIRAEECIQYGLDFPYIAKFYCTVVHDWSAWLVMEYVKGRTLCQILQRQASPMGLPQMQKIAAQVMVAIEYMHYNAVIFGDMTSDNLMIEEGSGDVKVIDFGLALRRNPEKRDETPKWLDEHDDALPSKSSNPFNDWYAYGILIYELLVANRDPRRLRVTGDEANAAWILPADLRRMDCLDLTGDAVGCDLVSKFIKYRSWKSIWGLDGSTRDAIRKHAWFKGFDWSTVDHVVVPKMRRIAYNRPV
jgi:serine/threonine protein kinase